jgi:hypothetical protein
LEHIFVFKAVHLVNDVVADLGLEFPNQVTVYEHLVWLENSSAIQFAAMKQDVLKKTVDVKETSVDADFFNIVKMRVSHFCLPVR